MPPQLMAAIGRVESGRRDPGTGAWGAWPWTINAEGQGSYFESKADAIRAVQDLQAHGVRSIDVGCMQVNLMHHPSAFPSLDMAFDPAVNADYAARFLIQLHEQTGDWTKATANYHSANPWEGEPYAAKVTSIWPEEQRKAGLNPAPPLQVGSVAGGVSGFPGRPFPGVFAMAPGLMRPVMAQARAGPPAPASPAAFPGRMMPLGITQGAAPAGTSIGLPSIGPGRGLAFYRAMPVRTVIPLQLTSRTANVLTR